MITNNTQENAQKNWRVISNMILNSKKKEFRQWIKEINPKLFERIQNQKKFSRKEGDSYKRHSSRSIAGISDDDASESSMQRRKLYK